MSAQFEAEPVRLVASPAAMAALRAGAGADPNGWAELEVAGAVSGEAPHAALEPALQAMRRPVCALDLQRGDRRGSGWVDPDLAAMLVPATGDRQRLVTVPTPFVPAALARMNDVGPRPRAERATRLRFEAAELLELLARREDPRGRIVTIREHWRVEARWPPSPDSPGVRAVEVVDTDAGMWVVVPDEPTVELWTTTPTAVWTLLAGLLPRDEELGG